jgi:hypothetical protein
MMPIFVTYHIVCQLPIVVQEDLNRVKKKPHVEKIESRGRDDRIIANESWRRYLLRNDSELVDRCFGQLKSHVTCTNCGNESVTFDEYSSISLPLPVRNTRKVSVVVQLLPLGSLPLKFELEVEVTAVMRDLKRLLIEALVAQKCLPLTSSMADAAVETAVTPAATGIAPDYVMDVAAPPSPSPSRSPSHLLPGGAGADSAFEVVGYPASEEVKAMDTESDCDSAKDSFVHVGKFENTGADSAARTDNTSGSTTNSSSKSSASSSTVDAGVTGAFDINSFTKVSPFPPSQFVSVDHESAAGTTATTTPAEGCGSDGAAATTRAVAGAVASVAAAGAAAGDSSLAELVNTLHFHFGTLQLSRSSSVSKHYNAAESGGTAITSFAGRYDTLVAFQLDHFCPEFRAVALYQSRYSSAEKTKYDPADQESAHAAVDVSMGAKVLSTYSTSYERTEMVGYPVKLCLPVGCTNSLVHRKVHQHMRRFLKEDSPAALSGNLQEMPYSIVITNAYGSTTKRTVEFTDDVFEVPTGGVEMVMVLWPGKDCEDYFDSDQFSLVRALPAPGEEDGADATATSGTGVVTMQLIILFVCVCVMHVHVCCFCQVLVLFCVLCNAY